METRTLEQLIETFNGMFKVKAGKFYGKGGPCGIKLKTSEVEKIVSILTETQCFDFSLFDKVK